MAVADYLADRAQELLDASVIALAQPRTGQAPPTHIYRGHNPPAVDLCTGGLLTVYLDSPAVAFSQVQQGKSVNTGQAVVLPVVKLVVELWRCVPQPNNQGTPPPDATLDTAYSNLMIDAQALQTGLFQSRAAGTLFPAGMGCALARIGDPIPLGPQGGAAGWRIRVDVPINDAGPPI